MLSLSNMQANRGPCIESYSLLGTIQDLWLLNGIAHCKHKHTHLQAVVDAQLAKQVLYIGVRPAATLQVGACVDNRGA